MQRKILEHLIGLSLIPLVLAVSVFTAGCILVMSVIVSIGLLVSPSTVSFSGKRLSDILRKAKR